MSDHPLVRLIPGLARCRYDGAADGELVGRYAHDRDEDAFAALQTEFLQRETVDQVVEPGQAGLLFLMRAVNVLTHVAILQSTTDIRHM